MCGRLQSGRRARHRLTTANAASFTREAEGDKALPVALTCVTVEAR